MITDSTSQATASIYPQYTLEIRSYFDKSWKPSQWSGDDDSRGFEPMTTFERALQQLKSARLSPPSASSFKYRLVKNGEDGLTEILDN